MKKGFTLLEMIIVITIITAVLGAVFSVAYRTQTAFESEKQFTETSQQARVTMDQIVRYLRQAGNDPTEYLKDNDIPAVRIIANGVVINSDITGSFDGVTGDPDGALDSPFEVVTVRYNSQRDEVEMDLNDNTGFHVVADNIVAFNMVFFDDTGTVTADSSEVAAVQIGMTANTARKDRRTGRINSVSYRSDVFVRSKSFDLFDPDH